MRLFISCSLLAFATGTTNAGWTTQSSGTSELLYSVYFLDSNNGWTVGRNGTILHTTDGGSVWTPQSSGRPEYLHSLFFIDANNGWAVGGTFVQAIIIHTTDGGHQWEIQAPGIAPVLQSVYFTDASNGWAGGYFGALFHTSDGGTHWNRRESGTFSWLRSIHFSDPRNGWAVGTEGGIVHTTNGGDTWSAQSSGIINDLNSVYFTDENNGWVVGGYPFSEGHILRTTNGGQVWNAQPWSGDWLYSVRFINANDGWAVGFGGVITHTTDGGTTCALESSVTSNWLRSVYFTDTNNGWAVGDNGTILRYSGVTPAIRATISPRHPPIVIPPEGGSYEYMMTLTNNTILSLGVDVWSAVVPPGSPSFLVSGPIHKTLDSARTASKKNTQEIPANSPPGEYLHILYAGTYPDSVMSSDTLDFGKLFSLEKNHPDHPTDVASLTRSEASSEPTRSQLSQNCPNPFNPTTVISFELTATSQTSLIVFDLLGREVATLVNENLPPGNYERSFDGTGLASGIYLYRLSAGSFVDVKKLVLSK